MGLLAASHVRTPLSLPNYREIVDKGKPVASREFPGACASVVLRLG